MLLIAMVLLAGGAESFGQTRVYAKLDSDTTIYPGQVFAYTIVVEGGSKPTQIDISPIAKFDPRRGSSGTSMESINGRTTMTHSQSFAITAEKPGTIVLPGINVVVDGKTYTTNAVEVTVAEPGTTDRLELEMLLSEETCYVGQPVVVTINWTIKAQVKEPAFNVPVFKSEDFYFEDPVQSDQAWASQQSAIHGVPITVQENRQIIKGVEAAIISFSKVLIPKRSGRFVLEPVTISADMMTGRVRTNDIFNRYRATYERFSVQSKLLELNVLPLPEEGKPTGFYGLVGNYTISTSATPKQVNVGDPITLTIAIGGGPYLTPVQWPALEAIPALANNFKIPAEKASPVTADGRKVFTQTIRAGNDAVTAIPGIPLAFFDPRTGRYTVAQSEPIALEVAPTKTLTTADVEGTSPGAVSRRVEAIREGFSANYYGPDVLANQTFSPLSAMLSPGYVMLWSIPLAAFLGSLLFKLATRTSPEAVARKRRRHACAAAIKQLNTIAAAESEQRHDLMVSAMKGYLGDRFAKTAGSLTADDCRAIVANATDDAQLADRFKATISQFEAARYASMDMGVDSGRVAEAIDLIRSVQEKSRR